MSANLYLQARTYGIDDEPALFGLRITTTQKIEKYDKACLSKATRPITELADRALDPAKINPILQRRKLAKVLPDEDSRVIYGNFDFYDLSIKFF